MKYRKGDIVAVQYVFTSVQQSRFRQDSLINNPIFGVVTDNQIYDMMFVKFADDRMQGIRTYCESQHNCQYYETATGMHVQISKVVDGVLSREIDETNKEQQIQI